MIASLIRYPLARFISEHGFQSFPSFESYVPVTAPVDHSRDSWLLFYRQRHQLGNEQVEKMMSSHFKVPPANVSTMQSKVFSDYLWLTQLQQGRCYETAFAQWRRQRSMPTNTMGVLYWQLNDIWPGPSWSTIEFDGTPKLSHHGVARAFAPVLVSATEAVGTGMLTVHLTNDLTRDLSDALDLEIYRWVDSPAVVLWRVAHIAVAPALGTQKGYTVNIDDLLAAASGGAGKLTRNETFVRLSFGGNGTGPIEAFHFWTPMKYATLPKASVVVLSVDVPPPSAGGLNASVRLRAERTAAFVSLTSLHVAGAFSDGAFMMLAGSEKTITFTAQKQGSWDDFGAGLRVRSLCDTFD